MGCVWRVERWSVTDVNSMIVVAVVLVVIILCLFVLFFVLRLLSAHRSVQSHVSLMCTLHLVRSVKTTPLQYWFPFSEEFSQFVDFNFT